MYADILLNIIFSTYQFIFGKLYVRRQPWHFTNTWLVKCCYLLYSCKKHKITREPQL